MKINLVYGFYAMLFLFILNKRFVSPVKYLQDQYILGVTGPTGPVTV